MSYVCLRLSLQFHVCVRTRHLTCAPELLAFNLANSFVGQPSRVAAAGSTGLNRVVKQVISQPLQVTVTHKGVLGQMTERGNRERRSEGMGVGKQEERAVMLCNLLFRC